MHHDVCLNMKKLLSLAAAVALVGWGLSAAAGSVEVLSPEGQSQATYDTFADALANVPSGGTVRLLADENVKCEPTFVRSCLLDLNGFTLGQKYFKFTSGVQLKVDGKGGKIDGRDSLFYLAGNCSVTLTNVALHAYNLVYAPDSSCRIDVHDGTKIQTGQLVSSWGNNTVRVHLWQGSCAVVDRIDDYDIRSNPRYLFHAGSLLNIPVPADRVDGKLVMAATEGQTFGGPYTYYYKVVAEEEYVPFDAAADFALDGVPAESLATAVAGSCNGSTLLLRRDCTAPVDSSGATVMNEFPKLGNANTFDLGGHAISTPSTFLRVWGSLTMTNGTVYITRRASTTAIFLTVDGCSFRSDKSLTFRADPNPPDRPDNAALAFVYSSMNSRHVIDGTSFINVNIASTWNEAAIASSEMIFTNNVVFKGDAPQIGYGDQKFPTLKICGGEWSLDPSTFLGTGCGVYHTNTVGTLPYFVTPLAQQTYDLSRPVTKRLFTVGSLEDAGSAFTVNLKGPNAFDLYELADYSALTGHGALQFVFTRDAASRKFLPVYRDGVLTAVRSGLAVLVR